MNRGNMQELAPLHVSIPVTQMKLGGRDGTWVNSDNRAVAFSILEAMQLKSAIDSSVQDVVILFCLNSEDNGFHF